jgi:hypothetical protein
VKDSLCLAGARVVRPDEELGESLLTGSNVTFFIGDISKPEDIANALEKVCLRLYYYSRDPGGGDM